MAHDVWSRRGGHKQSTTNYESDIKNLVQFIAASGYTTLVFRASNNHIMFYTYAIMDLYIELKHGCTKKNKHLCPVPLLYDIRVFYRLQCKIKYIVIMAGFSSRHIVFQILS